MVEAGRSAGPASSVKAPTGSFHVEEGPWAGSDSRSEQRCGSGGVTVDADERPVLVDGEFEPIKFIPACIPEDPDVRDADYGSGSSASSSPDSLDGITEEDRRYFEACFGSSAPPCANECEAPICVAASSTPEPLASNSTPWHCCGGWRRGRDWRRLCCSPRSLEQKDHVICTTGGKRPQHSDFNHCPIPQSYVRCGSHHRAELCVLSKGDCQQLHEIWERYQDDLTWPWYEKKPRFSDSDFDVMLEKAQLVVDAMVEEFQEPMVLDQATVSNTNHIGHPPHADNVQFDSVWWQGKRIRSEDEVVAAREGAYVLWRPEKTSYRSYSCTISLTDASNYEGGEVQFFERWGDKDPYTSYKCDEGCGVAFCGCNKNIHAVMGVRSGFRLVFLVWTRPPEVRVPESQAHVCYFRPGTGLGVWLTTADIRKHLSARRRKRGRGAQAGICGGAWVPVETEDDCTCPRCEAERGKLAWKDRDPTAVFSNEKPAALADSTPEHTPTTSAGNSPRTDGDGGSGSRGGGVSTPPEVFDETRSQGSGDGGGLGSEGEHGECGHGVSGASSAGESSDTEREDDEPDEALPLETTCAPPTPGLHCPYPRGKSFCDRHDAVELDDILSKRDMRKLYRIWYEYQDDLSYPWYEKKPALCDRDFRDYRSIAEKVVKAMSAHYEQPLLFDQATISGTNYIGHPPHADNLQFDSVWWGGRQIKQRDELTAARGGAEVLWKEAKTAYRNYSATIALTEPWEYGGGELEFYSAWGEREPQLRLRPRKGVGVFSCGCERNIRAVTGVKWGFRLCLLIWTRPANAEVPEDQKHVCYFRPGTGPSVWLTTADVENYDARTKRQDSGAPTVIASEADEEDSESNGDEGNSGTSWNSASHWGDSWNGSWGDAWSESWSKANGPTWQED